MNNLLKTTVLSAVGLLLISGCGGGGSSDSDQSGSTVASRGAITGFGSVYVNGVRFHTNSAHFSVDDSSGSESGLNVGMIVTVYGNLSSATEGTASSIVYDNELKGPVSAISVDGTRKILTILGVSVVVSADTVINNNGGLDFASLSVGDFLEVSGYITDTDLIATYVELENNTSKVETTGVIDNLTANSFTVNGFAVSYDGTTRLDDIGSLSDGLFVEVEGSLNAAGTVLLASEIEGKNDLFDDDYDQVEIKGVISGYDPANETFTLHGITVDASRARFEPSTLQLADGMTVEAEGFLSNGILVAREVKQRGRKIEIEAPLSAVDPLASTVSFDFNGQVVTLRVHAGTEIEDDNTGNDLLLSDLSAGHFVELEAFAEGSGVLNVIEIERTDPDEISVEAPVEAFDGTARTVTLLGIDFDLGAASFEDENDINISASAFFAALRVGVEVEIEDDDANGVFDKAKLED